MEAGRRRIKLLSAPGPRIAKEGGTLQDPRKIIEFSRYWLAKANGGALPAFKDILPEEICRTLPNLVIWRVIDGGRDFHCRLCGEELNSNYGWNPMGRRLTEIARDNPSVAIFADNFRLCLAHRAPITVIDSFEGFYGTRKRTIGVIAPLAGDGGEITDLICCSIYLQDGDAEEAERQLSDLFHCVDNTG